MNGQPVVQANLSGLEASSGGQSLKLNVGGTLSQLSTAKAGCCYHYINYKVSFDSELQNRDIGGLLGQDAHVEAATEPWQCKKGSVGFHKKDEASFNPGVTPRMQSLVLATGS